MLGPEKSCRPISGQKRQTESGQSSFQEGSCKRQELIEVSAFNVWRSVSWH
ncbi:hypothetical protein PDR5_30790 [Pseudomonas sp. DR 5-09]|nr:hypothetical protein PDR5_30790 [Pseudomonas sp. DR 5-09]